MWLRVAKTHSFVSGILCLNEVSIRHWNFQPAGSLKQRKLSELYSCCLQYRNFGTKKPNSELYGYLSLQIEGDSLSSQN